MKRFLFLTVPFLMLISCTEEPLQDTTPSELSFTAVFGDDISTKTGFDSSVFEWRTGDRIRVALSGGKTLDMRYPGENTSASATFTQTETPAGTVIYGDGGFAIYPSLAESNCRVEASTLTLGLKSSYAWSEGNAEAPMISKVIKGQSLSFSHLGGLLKVSLSNVPSSAAKLMVLTPGYVTSKNMPVQGWSGSFTEDKPYVQAYAGEDGLIGVSFTPGTSSYMDFYVPLPVGPGVTHTYPEIRIYLVDSAGSTISGTLRAAADVRIDRAHIKPMSEVAYPALKAPNTVTTLFGNAGFSNPVVGKAGGNSSEAILGAARGMVWTQQDHKAIIFDQVQSLRLWDLDAGTISEPVTYGTSSCVPWLGNMHGGKVYFAEKATAAVWSYNPSDGVFTKEAAQAGWSGNSVMDLVYDSEGNAYVAVRNLNTIYKFSGGDITAEPSLSINIGKWPLAMEFDADGNLIVATNGCQLLKVNVSTGTYEAIAGILDAKAIADGTAGSPLTAKFTAGIGDIAIAPNGDIYVADTYRVRRIRKGSLGYSNAVVSTVAGGSQAANRAAIVDGVGTSANFRQMGGLLLNSKGSVLYITDQGTGHVRELYLGDPDGPVDEKTTVRAATFNIRFVTDKDTEERSWTSRRTGVVQLIKDYDFDITGFQESRPEQRTYLKDNLPDYTFFETPEEPCMAWKTARFVLLGSGYFYLSATPDVASSPYPGWVSTDPGRKRVCQWAKLEDRESGRKILYLNTHLEVTSSGTSISEEEAVTIRTNSADLICSRIASLSSGEYSVILGGDMNSSTTEAAHTDYFKAQLTDSYYRSADLGVKEGPVATYNAYSYEEEQRSKWYHRIDYLYFKGPLDVVRYKVIDDLYGGYYTSDHWPLMVVFALN